MHGELKICAYPHHGYWEDVGSLKDYYAANMALAADVSLALCLCSRLQVSECCVWKGLCGRACYEDVVAFHRLRADGLLCRCNGVVQTYLDVCIWVSLHPLCVIHLPAADEPAAAV